MCLVVLSFGMVSRVVGQAARVSVETSSSADRTIPTPALACGRVAKRSGEVLIGKVISHSFEKDSSYHLPTSKVTSRNDVEYDPELGWEDSPTTCG